MIGLSLQRAASLLGLEDLGTGRFEGITTDSRKVRPGMMFAALGGERVDGHDFAGRAAASGAAALLVARPLSIDLPQLVVDDVLQAAAEMCHCQVPVTGIKLYQCHHVVGVKEIRTCLHASLCPAPGPFLVTELGIKVGETGNDDQVVRIQRPYLAVSFKRPVQLPDTPVVIRPHLVAG